MIFTTHSPRLGLRPNRGEFEAQSSQKRMMANRAVFLDRDGTINEEVGYVNHIGRFWLLPRVGEAIRLLNQHEFKTVVVTNQSGAARGYFVETLIHEVHQKMKTLLSKEGAHLDGVFYCPHHPDQKCRCRKPETGLIEEAAKELGIDCSRSYMVGDRRGDIEFANKVGAKGILVLTGYGRGEWENFEGDWSTKPSYVAQDLYDAVQWILSQESKKNRKE